MDADDYTARISLTPQPHREYVKNVEEEEAMIQSPGASLEDLGSALACGVGAVAAGS